MAAFGNTRDNDVLFEEPPPRDCDSTVSSPSTIRRELQHLRGELFDILDANSSVAIILTKVQQLTEFENRIVEEQRLEIERLSVELKELRIQQKQHQVDGLESLPSFGNIVEMVSSNSSTTSSSSSSSSTSSAGFTNESERETSYSLFANEKLATKANLSLGIAEMRYSKDVVRDLEERIRICTDEIEELSNWKNGIIAEIEELKNQSQSLRMERNKLMQEVEVYTHQSELAAQLECVKEESSRIQNEMTTLRTALEMQMMSAKETEDKLLVAEREKARAEDIAVQAEERAHTEEIIRKEMESEMQSLYKEKIALQKEIDDWKLTNRGGGELTTSTATNGREDVQRLKEEVQALRGENASLRSAADRDCETIAALNDEIQSLEPSMEYCQNSLWTTEEYPASRKRTLANNNQGSVGEEDERSREHKRLHERPNAIGNGCLELIDGSTRVRSNTGGSDTLDGDTVSAMHEADSDSLLFGQNSVDDKPNSINDDSAPCDSCISVVKSTPDHNVIRAHAEKVLYWANRVSERSKNGCSPSSSVASRQEVKELRGGEGFATTPKKRDTSSPSASPIPETIGLPPRSQSRVRKSSQLPPRCPPSTSAAPSLTMSSSSSGEGETLDCNSSSSSSDKENGGSSFNREVLGAFPKLSSTKQSRNHHLKNVTVVECGTIFHDSHNLEEQLCCECSTSPFSGNDPQSEFYLPKLGLACNCAGASIIEDRESFSKNPTALSNILRPWQCSFLESLSITTADELLNAHRAGANAMARKMRNWRALHGGNMKVMRSRECYVALKVWCCTCKVVLRSIREQKEQARRMRGSDDNVQDADDDDINIEKPHFLDISFADMHTITSISTLGQISSECGRPFEMMEI
ncbi:hypothetical protein ACHAXH_007796 [Discostella pseudostelligera]